ncbi:MAG: pyridoxal-phosphate dependent enzyme [Asgard group archaeon]|nr:pyridoxal-phosphate dependent enzyme [Asgard group archaeon]
MSRTIICLNCQAELYPKQRSLTCPQCSSNDVVFTYSVDDKNNPVIQQNEKGIWRFKDFLPLFKRTISLGESNTPIHKARFLFKSDVELHLKIEGKNPTGSFLDRVSPLMISDALSREMHSVVCASDGNLGASLSAYCAAAQLQCYCVVPKSTSPEKRTQMLAFGAEIIDYGKTIDESLNLATKMIEKGRYQATPEFNILTLEGTKTIALEIAEQFYSNNSTNLLDYVIVPMGSGNLLYSIWLGFKQAKKFGLIPTNKALPKIIGVQLKGFDPITKAFESGNSKQLLSGSSKKRNSVAGAILVQKPIFGEKAIQSLKESNGLAVSVTDKELIHASKQLGKYEGVYAELSSATVIAAVSKLLEEKQIPKDSTILSIITASGFKSSQAFEKGTYRVKRVESFRSLGTKAEILQVINSGESNFGYGIWKALGETISLQAVYQHLKELQNQLMLITEVESSDRQKRYQLTTKGKQIIVKMQELEELLS